MGERDQLPQLVHFLCGPVLAFQELHPFSISAESSWEGPQIRLCLGVPLYT